MWVFYQNMVQFWIFNMVMGAIYLFGFWDGEDSPAFIIGQIVLSGIGLSRELYLKKHGVNI